MKRSAPPKFPFKLLKWFCRPDYFTDVEGDLLELYERRVNSIGAEKRQPKISEGYFIAFQTRHTSRVWIKTKNKSHGTIKTQSDFHFQKFQKT